jgi:uncharacterized protein YjiS (DUF1127 family)
MSIRPSGFPPSTFVRHDDFWLYDANNTTSADGVSRGPGTKQNCDASAALAAAPKLLRDNHIVLLAIDALLALHTSFKKWRSRRRTLRALADLDERQLRDIGFTRDDALYGAALWSSGRNNCFRALAELDASELSNLSEFGPRVWREARSVDHRVR